MPISRRTAFKSILSGLYFVKTLEYAYARPANARFPFSILDVEPRAGKSLDNTDAFEKAISVASREKLGSVWLPPGEYPARRLKLQNSVFLHGGGRGATIISALPSEDPAFVTMDEGPVLYSGLRNLTVKGGTPAMATNAGQWGVQLIGVAAKEGVHHGGLWWSHFEDLEVLHFDRGLALEGGGQDFMVPHQFFSMRDMLVMLPGSAIGPNLLMSGQVAQGLFEQCQFDSVSKHKSPAVHITHNAGGTVAPALHHFDVCTLQTAGLGFLIDRAQNITVSNSWFENDDAGVRVTNEAFEINIIQNRFANSGDENPAISFEPSTSGVITGNLFAGARTHETIRIAPEAKVVSDEGAIIWGAKK